MPLIPEAIIKKRYPRWIAEKGMAVMNPVQHERVAPEDFAEFLKENNLVPVDVSEGAVNSGSNPDEPPAADTPPAPSTVISRSGAYKKGR